jgi:D-3-phosphoglycerate dehydrogenase
MSLKVLITESIHECIIPMLEEAGYEVHYEPKITREDILEKLHQYVGVIVRSKTPADEEFMRAGANLGLSPDPAQAWTRLIWNLLQIRNITLLNAPEGNRDAVG